MQASFNEPFSDGSSKRQLASWSYAVGASTPVNTALSEGLQRHRDVHNPRQRDSVSGVTATVSASDGAGPGPSATTTLGGCPQIKSVSTMPNVENPTVVITGYGFGTAATTDPGFQTNGDTHYFQMLDTTPGNNWEAGGYNSSGQPDGCTAIVGYWSNTEIIVSPQINRGFGTACQVHLGDNIEVQVWPNGSSASSAR